MAEDIRDKIFDVQIIAALGRALSEADSEIKSSIAQILTVAIAHGALRRSRGIFMLKYSQRVFESI